MYDGAGSDAATLDMNCQSFRAGGSVSMLKALLSQAQHRWSSCNNRTRGCLKCRNCCMLACRPGGLQWQMCPMMVAGVFKRKQPASGAEHAAAPSSAHGSAEPVKLQQQPAPAAAPSEAGISSATPSHAQPEQPTALAQGPADTQVASQRNPGSDHANHDLEEALSWLRTSEPASGAAASGDHAPDDVLDAADARNQEAKTSAVPSTPGGPFTPPTLSDLQPTASQTPAAASEQDNQEGQDNAATAERMAQAAEGVEFEDDAVIAGGLHVVSDDEVPDHGDLDEAGEDGHLDERRWSDDWTQLPPPGTSDGFLGGAEPGACPWDAASPETSTQNVQRPRSAAARLRQQAAHGIPQVVIWHAQCSRPVRAISLSGVCNLPPIHSKMTMRQVFCARLALFCWKRA